MRILELKLSNFRGFESQRVEFSPQFTVIAGINGRGKTAILEALALLISRLLPQITQARGGYRSFGVWDIRHDEITSNLGMRANCAGIPLEFLGNILAVSRLQKFTRLSEQVRKEIRNAYGHDRNRATDAAPITVYYTTDRASYSQPRNLSGNVARGQAAAYHRALLKKKVDFKDFIRRYRVMSLLSDGSSRENPYFIGQRAADTIRRVLHEFLGEFRDIKAVDDGRPKLVLQKGAVPLDPSQLSDGERSFLAMVTDLCRRLWLANPELEDSLQGAGVVLIDELELHLHPAWQREIVEKLRRTFPNIQFIATTHSPFVIQTLRQGELVLLDDIFAASYSGRGIEDVARFVMGIESPEMSPRYQEMLNVAREYFRLLDGAKEADETRKRELRHRLAEMTAPYTDNPAYQALLEQKRIAGGME